METPMTKQEMENFAVKLTDDSADHNAWLALIQYGLDTFLKNQPLFIEVVIREAEKQLSRKDIKGRVIADEVRAIFKELGLRLVIEEKKRGDKCQS